MRDSRLQRHCLTPLSSTGSQPEPLHVEQVWDISGCTISRFSVEPILPLQTLSLQLASGLCPVGKAVYLNRQVRNLAEVVLLIGTLNYSEYLLYRLADWHRFWNDNNVRHRIARRNPLVSESRNSAHVLSDKDSVLFGGELQQ